MPVVVTAEINMSSSSGLSTPARPTHPDMLPHLDERVRICPAVGSAGTRPGGSCGVACHASSMDPTEDAAAFGASAQLALLDVLPEMVVVIDAATRIRWVNGTTRRLLGYELDELVGTSIFDFVH